MNHTLETAFILVHCKTRLCEHLILLRCQLWKKLQPNNKSYNYSNNLSRDKATELGFRTLLTVAILGGTKKIGHGVLWNSFSYVRGKPICIWVSQFIGKHSRLLTLNHRQVFCIESYGSRNQIGEPWLLAKQQKNVLWTNIHGADIQVNDRAYKL
jgi:hypothetical protein